MKAEPPRTGRRCVVQLLPAMHTGGVERGTLEVAACLAAKGHRSVVVSSSGRLVPALCKAGAEHIDLSVGRKNPVSAWFCRQRLKKLFQDMRPDIVHARSRLPAWLAYSALQAMPPAERPAFVTTVHGLYSVKRYSSIMARGDRVIAVSRTAADYVTKHYKPWLKRDPVVVYRGIDPDEFPYGHRPDASFLDRWRWQCHQLAEHKTVLLPGRLSRLKGGRDLLYWLQCTTVPARLLLTARPDDDVNAARLYRFFEEHGVANKVVWLGLQERMADVYAAVDVVVNASRKPESFGRTVAEALAVGTPVVGYDHGGVGEILQAVYPHGRVPVGDRRALACRLDEVLVKPWPVPDKQPFLLSDMLRRTYVLYQDLWSERPERLG